MRASDNVNPKVILAEGAAPATPDAGQVKLFAKTDGLLYSKDDAGSESRVSGGSGVTDEGAFTYLDATEAAAPATPASGYARIYAKTDGRIYSKDDAGTEYGPFDAAGGGGGESAAIGTNWSRFPWGAVGWGASPNTASEKTDATDGSSATGASSNSGTVPQAWIFDLSDTRSVSRVEVVYPDSGHRSATGTLDYSDDGSSWTNAASWTSDATTTRAHTFSAVSGRFWRIYTTEQGTSGNGLNITEIRFIYAGADGSAVDHAAGLTPTSNATYSNIGYATDGWENNKAGATSAPTPHTFEVDLGSAKEVAGFVVCYGDSSHSMLRGKLQYSTDDTNWTTAFEWGIANASVFQVHALDDPVTARYWRTLGVTQGHANGIDIKLFQLWG